MREGMNYDDATFFVETFNEIVLNDVVYILRHVKGAKSGSIAKMTIEEIRYFSLLAQDDLKALKTSAEGGNTE
jgi:hypothetical protein